MNATVMFLRIPYETTALLDFEQVHQRADLPCHEVRNTGNIFAHKPLRKQGRLVSSNGAS